MAGQDAGDQVPGDGSVLDAAEPQPDAEQPPDPAKVAAEVERLAALSRVAYDHCRESQAKRLGIRVSTLDAEVERLRKP